LIAYNPEASLDEAGGAPFRHKEQSSEELELGEAVRADIQRYRRLLDIYRSNQANTNDLERGFFENTKETERHLENVKSA
jgi:hypothetical protein